MKVYVGLDLHSTAYFGDDEQRFGHDEQIGAKRRGTDCTLADRSIVLQGS